MLTKKRTYILSYNTRVEFKAESIEEAAKIAKAKYSTPVGTVDGSVVDEQTGEEIFF